jgi:Skp family chaperone for outer membrane proteins
MIAMIARQGTGLARLSVFLYAGRFVTLAAPVYRLDFEGIRIMQKSLPILLAGVCLASVSSSKGVQTMRHLLLAIIILGSATASGSAQPVASKPEPPALRFAVVNVGHVFNEYDKAQAFKKGLEQSLAPFKEEAARINNDIKAWEAAIEKKNFGAVSKEEYEERIIEGKRRLEDMSRDIQKLHGKKQEQNLVILWKEVQAGIKTYAEQNNIDVVFGYGDPMDKELLDLFPNVNRKMQAMDLGSTVPLFVTPRAEIGDAVVKLLNTQYREQKKKQPRTPALDLD